MKKLIILLMFFNILNAEYLALRMGHYYPGLKERTQQIVYDCNNKNMLACNNLAYLYANKKGFMKNLSMAKRYFYRACDYGIGVACYNLSIVDNEYNKDDLLELACELGDYYSCRVLRYKNLKHHNL